MINPKLIPEVNVGLVGHVSHGKTSIVKAITGKTTLMHSEELKRGITIRLGYADETFYKCERGHYTTSKKCPICFKDCQALRTVSFVDVPGHETLMATVLTGASLMDGAMLIIAANEKCPQPQTREHLTALEVVGIKNVIILQNKIDLVSEERARESYEEIKNFIKGTFLENAPIIPVSAEQMVNIDLIIEAIEKFIKTPKREEKKDLRMFVARSFDINKPGTRPEKLVGGVLGGAIISGKLKLDDEIEIRPGVKIKENYQPLTTKVKGLQKAGINLKEAAPGGLVGVLTNLDPFLTKSDGLVGNVIGFPGKLPEVRNSLEIEINLLERVVGLKEFGKVEQIKVGEQLMINIGTARSLVKVDNIRGNIIKIILSIPVCAEKSQRLTISRQIAGRWRLIGYGEVI
ncbi:MAG: translation initiation factor IF-2 subunit gamma [Candidatus Aenigmarchaeota archaeon]|nr:translation initiation factor IF-2 subunit gamma [Candidatus Aenigmarchaeota archaeon]